MGYPLIRARDLEFWLYEWLDAGQLYSHAAYAEHSRESVATILELSEQLATDLFLPHYKDADRHEPRLCSDGVRVLPGLASALRGIAESGLFGAGFPTTLGGSGLPQLICSASFAQFAAANISASAFLMLTAANARLLAAFGSPAQVEQFARPQIEGRWFGTMCLSEPQAGSSLADIRTRAELVGEDELGARYRITGNKMWISAGDHDVTENIVHLVLAKVPGPDGLLPEGTRGISLFVVPKFLTDSSRNDVVVAGLNHKMGYRGTPNCLLNFGEHGGATGWRVGELGNGLRYMFLMMNEARIGVGLGAAALGYRGFQQSLRYARERTQGRAPGVRQGAPVPLIEHADVCVMLLAQKCYSEGALALCLYCARLIDDRGNSASERLLGLLTPVAKTWPSEYGLAANDLAIQIHGGYGYSREFDVEQLYRDNRLNPIHEGTTGVQALDLLGRKILGDHGAALAELVARIHQCAAKARNLAALAPLSEQLLNTLLAVERATAVLPADSQNHRLDNATAFLRAFGHLVVGWLWLDQAELAAKGREGLGSNASGNSDADFYDGKLAACQYFYAFELPKIDAWLAPVASKNRLASLLRPVTL